MLTDTELQALLLALKNTTQLSRLNAPEAEAVFARLAELGYTISKPTPAAA